MRPIILRLELCSVITPLKSVSIILKINYASIMIIGQSLLSSCSLLEITIRAPARAPFLRYTLYMRV